MKSVLRKGDRGTTVRALQRLLKDWQLPVTVDGVFGPQTRRAVRAFQSQHLDKHGRPLVVDGVVGALTWWSLKHPRNVIAVDPVISYARMPHKTFGGTTRGRNALRAAIGELKADAREIGGNNRGKWVRKYLNDLAPAGSSWCAGFVSWCFSRNRNGIPFKYSVGARSILYQFKKKGWAIAPGDDNEPQPGDIVVWWREQLAGWKGHIGIVHHVNDGMLYTIEGNKSNRVQGFDYVQERMKKLLGFGRVPEGWGD